jgi:hypothetical protein
MRLLIANKDLYYGRMVMANEEFRATNQHAFVLVASGQAREVIARPFVRPTVKEPPSRRTYRRRDMVPERR